MKNIDKNVELKFSWKKKVISKYNAMSAFEWIFFWFIVQLCVKTGKMEIS